MIFTKQFAGLVGGRRAIARKRGQALSPSSDTFAHFRRIHLADTISYIATDNWGNSAATTRTILIEAPSIVPTPDATSTVAASTSQ